VPPSLGVIGHATNIVIGLDVCLQDTVLPITVITAGMWIAYSVGDGIYDVAVVAAAMLSVAGVEATRVDRGRLGRGYARASRRSPRRARGRHESAPGPPP
jgi:hypothetical protein